MKKTILSLLTASVFFFSCKKEEHLLIVEDVCLPQLTNPEFRSYSCDSFEAVSSTLKHCGLLPLSQKNYWVYEDSIFNDGVLSKVQYDTLRFANAFRSPDGLVWFEPSISVGLPEKMYANDSAIFTLEQRLFSPEPIVDVKKEFGLFPGDSLKYLAHFDDFAAAGRSVKLDNEVDVPAGSFDDCILFEKNARSYRRDQLYFKPGFGVLKYIQEKAQMGSPIIKLQQISTLIKFHIE